MSGAQQLNDFVIFVKNENLLFEHVHNNKNYFKEYVIVLTKPHVPYFSKLIISYELIRKLNAREKNVYAH